MNDMMSNTPLLWRWSLLVKPNFSWSARSVSVCAPSRSWAHGFHLKKNPLGSSVTFLPLSAQECRSSRGQKSIKSPTCWYQWRTHHPNTSPKSWFAWVRFVKWKALLTFFTQLVVVFCFSGDCFFLYYSSNIKSVLF